MWGRPGVLLIWAGLALALLLPVAVAAASPLQGSRGAAYVAASLAGVIGLAILTLQPLLAAGYLPGPTLAEARRWHRWLGAGLVAAVAVHIGGLYLTSPPDTLDALLLVSPTPFSVYGVTAMWGVALTGLLVAARRRLGLRPATWRALHNGLALIVVVATVVHALMIAGAMGPITKLMLCIGALATTGIAVVHLRVLRPLRQRPRSTRAPNR